MSCCSRLKAEWNLSMFSLEDTNGQTVDLKQTLAPKPALLYGAIKACIFIWFATYCIIDSVTYEHGGLWFIFLTHWGVTLMYLYMVSTTFGFIRTIYLEKNQLQRGTENNSHTFLTRFISSVGVLAVNVEVLIILIYWLTIYDGRVITFQNLEKHGILGFFILFDKLVIHRMPIRLKQIFLQFAFDLVFLIWTLIHAALGVGHPESDNDPETDDDAIYATVNWVKRPGGAAIMVGSLLFVVTPVIFLILFGLSLLVKPYYYRPLEANKADEIVDEEP